LVPLADSGWSGPGLTSESLPVMKPPAGPDRESDGRSEQLADSRHGFTCVAPTVSAARPRIAGPTRATPPRRRLGQRLGSSRPASAPSLVAPTHGPARSTAGAVGVQGGGSELPTCAPASEPVSPLAALICGAGDRAP